MLQQYWHLGAVAVVLGVSGVSDARSGRIPNAVTYPAFALGLIGHTLGGGLGGEPAGLGLFGALAGAAMGAVLLPVWLAGGIGGGDAKLMIAVGALTGWQFALATMFWGFLVAAAMALIVMLRRRILRRTLGRIGRYVYVALGGAKPADPTGEQSPRVPFGLALCVGAAAAVGEMLILGRPLLQRAVEG
ncbi:MAG: prepilin peptidase [Planctomycetota bacterium]